MFVSYPDSEHHLVQLYQDCSCELPSESVYLNHVQSFSIKMLFTVVIGTSTYPIIPVGSVAMCVWFFLITTELESSKFFDGFSMKEKKDFSILAENVFDVFQRKVGSIISILSKLFLYLSVGNVIFVQFWF